MVAIPINKSDTVAAIEAARAADQVARHGYRISPSTLGTECERALWYTFRWASKPEPVSGQLARLFETGHIQEARMIADLRRIEGVTVVEYDDVATEKQIGIAFADGHGYGFLDAEASGLPEAPVTVHVVECKSHNDKSFGHVRSAGVMSAKPEHYAQIMLYMHLRQRTRGLYMAVNKNTDELYTERLEYDFKYSVALEKKAERIVNAHAPLAKLHEDPTARQAFKCGWCNHKPICHEGAGPLKNCRTCLSVTPAADGKWLCEYHGTERDRAEQNAGCPQHLFIPDLVPGDQVDADSVGQWVDYAMPNGTTWRNERGAL